MGRFLTKQERKLLEKELRLERYARFSGRIKCILLLDAGKSPESIAEYLFLSRNTIANYLKRYHTGGLEGLVSQRLPRERMSIKRSSTTKVVSTFGGNALPDGFFNQGIHLRQHTGSRTALSRIAASPAPT